MAPFLATETGTAGNAPTQLRCNVCLTEAYSSQSLAGCHDDHVVVSMRAQAHDGSPLQQCVSVALVHRNALSRLACTRIAGLDLPPSVLRRIRALRKYFACEQSRRYMFSAAGPHGLCSGRCPNARPTFPAARSMSRVQARMCLRTYSRVRLNAARERTACARIQAIVRAMTLPEHMVRKCAAAPARNYSMLLGDTRVSTWILRSVQRQCCA